MRPLIPSLILTVGLPIAGCGKSSERNADSSVASPSAGGGTGEQSSGGALTGGGPPTGGSDSTGGSGGGRSGGGGMGGEGSLPSGGVDGSGSSDGAGGRVIEGCDESPAERCRAEGDLVCDAQGRVNRCDECLQHELEGTECLRQLSIARERGLICAIKGQDELICVAGDFDWMEPHWGSFDLPERPLSFALAEDASPQDFPSSCWINQASELRCSGDPGTVRETGCTHLSLGTAADVAAYCDDELVTTISTIPLQPESLLKLAMSDASIYYLDDAGQLHPPGPGFPTLEGTFVDVVLSDLQTICGARADGALVCLHESQSGPFETPGDFVQVAGSGDNVKCGLGEDGSITCFALDETGFSQAFSPPGSDFVSLVSGHDESCALTRIGTATCWDEEGLLSHDAPLFE